ncbi:hypothetical protein KOY_05469 [Bacillus cereus VDM021]|uniref:hypothetical protein n=1 Tax=Bacillus cereus group TaxID=86661 RepID=UPI0001A16536|nr:MULTISPECIES: hypothetical protein [Bacillus cereus group]EOP48719.1 hypothetical protein IIW_05333 [Bacillus cereus VD136]EOP63477.1 hypothetical protein KOW_05503 [Bacillus cereus VDM006]EOQ18026.1 hypothetical protein KOY_05469 [Bacillus cereus VDM021]AJH16782.1 putative membrane protein [Bacillus mycoides]EEL96313.1 hypothetical protein bmyco0001_52680 [Bacillus mycoides DSM 2048]
MNKKVKKFKYLMIILACIAIFGTILPNSLDPDETLAGNISVAVFGIIGTCLLFSITYFIVKKAILRG